MVADAGKSGLADGHASFETACETPSVRPRRTGINLDLAMLIYTSGSTGFPKGVMMTHQNVDAAATSITTYVGNTPDDIILAVSPISFDYGLYQVLMAVKVGATLVLEKSFAFPQAILNRIAQEKVTGFPLVPTMAALLLQMKDLRPGQYPTLRYITNTAAALPPAHIARLQELFPTTTLFSMYGLTECKRCTYLPPEQLKTRPGSVGIAIPGTEAYVVGDDGVPLPFGSTGELVIRGPHVMKGYWENAEATAKALRPGPLPQEMVLYTGDLFRTDEEGFLYFLGRKDDIIKTRGEKVSPKEVENVLYSLAGVREAAVVGVPDPVLGLAIKAVISLETFSALAAADVIRHCAKHLEDFMVPKHVEIRDQLPKSENGKIARRQIEAEVLETAQ
jgi:acyl-CoA synthetase (AMP-forming)/AMP-acid ligase II